MKGSDKVDITINIVGELIKLNVDFDEQNSVRDAETAIKAAYEKLKKAWPNNSDKNLLAMVAFQFAKSYHNAISQQAVGVEDLNEICKKIDNLSLSDSSNDVVTEHFI